MAVLIAVSDFVGRCSWVFGLRFDFGCGVGGVVWVYCEVCFCVGLV